jgi:outer membrane protein TolC
LLVIASVGLLPAAAQTTIPCAGRVDETEHCFRDVAVAATPVAVDSTRNYRLEELIDIAETNHPRTRMAWEQAKQAAERVGIARAAYLPELALLAYFGDERIINPFPKPLAPRGYTMVEMPTVAPKIGLAYALFDSGARHAQLDRAKAEQLAASAGFARTNQQVAYDLVRAYYAVLTGEQRLEAAEQVLRTARTTQEATEAELANGRATLPDVLNARAETARAEYDREAADGAVREARVALRDQMGVDPSDEIRIARPATTPEALEVTQSIEELVHEALADRPDLQQMFAQLKANEAGIRAAKANERPSLQLGAQLGQTALWPTSDYGQLGAADQTTWSAGVNFQWNLFDGGKRRAEVAAAQSAERERTAGLRDEQNRIARQVWTAYLGFRTAMRKHEAAASLKRAAQTSYAASFEAYKYGVKNYIDVAAAEKQLSESEFTLVASESEVWTSALELEFATGHLLRSGIALAHPPSTENKK